MDPTPLQTFAPCHQSLLNLAMAHVDTSMLRQIAMADYGMDVGSHYEALADIFRSGITSSHGQWHPREVLELTRWSEPDQPHHPDDAAGPPGHWIRLFACAVLLRVDRLPECRNHLLGVDSTIIQLTESAIALGSKVVCAAISLLAWYLQEDETDLCPHCAVAILLLAVHAQTTDTAAFAWLISVIRGEHQDVDQWDEWSLDLKYIFADCQRKNKWRQLTTQILLAPNQNNAAVRDIAEALLG